MEYKNPCNNHVNYCRDFDLFRPTLVQYIRYHVFYILSDLYEIFIQDAFPFLPRLKRVELRQWYIHSFLLLDFLHVEIRFAEELRGLELLRFLYVHRTSYTGFCLDEVPCRLTAYPARRHIRDFRGGYEAVHVFIQVDGSFVPVYRDTLFDLHHLAEYVA